MALLDKRSTWINLVSGLLLALLGVILIVGVQLSLQVTSVAPTWRAVVNVAAIALFAIILAPLRQIFTTLIKTRILRGEVTDQEFLRQLSLRLLESTDLASVMTTSLDIISRRLNAPYAVCYILHREEEGNLVVKQVIPWNHPAKELPSLDQKGMVLDYLARTGHTVQGSHLAAELIQEAEILQRNAEPQQAAARRTFVSAHATKNALLDTLHQLRAELAIPLLARDQLFGVIFLAPNNQNRSYTNDELAFVDVATAETITSVQRANYFEGDLQKTEFISIASHELRTPLTAVRGYLSMILDEHLTGTELDAESTLHLQQVYSITRQLIVMVNDLLTLSRLESGKTKIVPTQVDLREIIQQALAKRKADADHHQVTLAFSPHRVVPHAWVDPDGITTVLDNFISNAIFYNRKGGTVKIKIHSHPSEGVLEIEIQDTGIGMSKEQMSHLFEKFYRVESPQTEGITGTGLGLNISQTYMRAMHSSIKISSQPGKGTRVLLLVPLFTDAKLQETATELTPATSAGTPLGLMVLSPKKSGESFSENDLQLLETIGNQAIITIQRAKLYEGDQMKTQFVSIASHELLTPISAIEGYLNMVMTKNAKVFAPKTAEFLTNVHSAIHRLSTLVSDLLSVSRLESGKISFDIHPMDLSKSVKETMAQLEFVGKELGIKLKVEKLPKSLPQVLADPERTTQVLMNLVGNAIKYNRPKGTVTVAVEVAPTEHQVKISVADTGIGMNKEQMSHLFEKFYRIASEETVGIVGTGLGLYITKSMVEHMNGTITVKSTAGKGSTFSFTLPVVPHKPVAAKK